MLVCVTVCLTLSVKGWTVFLSLSYTECQMFVYVLVSLTPYGWSVFLCYLD